MLLDYAAGLQFGFDLRVVDVPEVALGVHELDSNLTLAALLRAHMNHATFALFLREAIYYEDRLPALELGGDCQAGAMRVHI